MDIIMVMENMGNMVAMDMVKNTATDMVTGKKKDYN